MVRSNTCWGERGACLRTSACQVESRIWHFECCRGEAGRMEAGSPVRRGQCGNLWITLLLVSRACACEFCTLRGCLLGT